MKKYFLGSSSLCCGCLVEGLGRQFIDMLSDKFTIKQKICFIVREQYRLDGSLPRLLGEGIDSIQYISDFSKDLLCLQSYLSQFTAAAQKLITITAPYKQYPKFYLSYTLPPTSNWSLFKLNFTDQELIKLK